MAELMLIHHKLTGNNTTTKTAVAAKYYLKNVCMRVANRISQYMDGDTYCDTKYLHHNLLDDYNVEFFYPWVASIQAIVDCDLHYREIMIIFSESDILLLIICIT